jgi:uncharacterized iron-regulated protein
MRRGGVSPFPGRSRFPRNNGRPSMSTRTQSLVGPALALALLGACQAPMSAPHGKVTHPPGSPVSSEAAGEAAARAGGSTPVVDVGAVSDLDAILPLLGSKRVVFVGETHNRYEHHLMQLDIISGLHEINPDLAIGMEMFQQPFQHYLDEYIAGRLDERGLLRETQYYKRWGFDYRLYAPILEYARRHRVPIVALNLPREITRKVGREGLDSLTDEDRAQLPRDLDRSDTQYRERLQQIFSSHPGSDAMSFENFLDVQLLWDEGMADAAARYLKRHPGRQMVVLAGSGHLAFGSGIPDRLVRRSGVDTAIVLNAGTEILSPEVADYVVFPEKRQLPPSGRIGIMLENVDDGLRIDYFTSGSAGKAAGMKTGDLLVAIDDEQISDNDALGAVMWDKRPGDTVAVKVLRRTWPFRPKEMEFNVILR